ncbi:MAG: arginine N-succinyltransferase [Arenicella sp.]|jgi:arginine N-succinyltransferase
MKELQSDRLIIRAAVADDIDRLLELSNMTGSGMTSMPTDRKSWEDKLSRSISDFNNPEPKKNGDIYFMVLADLNTNQIVGSGAVYAGIGLHRPFYSYKLSTISTSSEKLNLTVHTRILSLVNDFSGTTEIGSLFLLPEYRRDGIGKFLSRSRFLMLADFPERFDETIFAEMRGWLDEDDNSPFWEHLGRKFFGLSFQKADFISAVDGFQFISDLMPKYPVYLDLLPEAAQEVIGKPHAAAAGAFNILKKEGFRYSGYVDIFDAGPSVKTRLKQIKTVAESRKLIVNEILPDSDLEGHESYLVSNSRLSDYRMIRAPLIHRIDDHYCAVSASAADTLKLEVGDPFRAVKERQVFA